MHQLVFIKTAWLATIIAHGGGVFCGTNKDLTPPLSGLQVDGYVSYYCPDKVFYDGGGMLQPNNEPPAIFINTPDDYMQAVPK